MPIAYLEIRTGLEILSFLAVTLGVPIGLYRMYLTARKEQQDREYGTYNALDARYIDFLELCFNNPHLDIFDIQDHQSVELSPIQKKQELVAFSILFSILERAFLMYSDQASEVKRRQWSGWRDYIEDFCERTNFREAWESCGEQFDVSFVVYVTDVLNQPSRSLPLDVSSLHEPRVPDDVSLGSQAHNEEAEDEIPSQD